MSDSDGADSGGELSKKQRLVNAWIAVGPEGKTTDVSEVTDSSRGYASDVRRAMSGEADDELEFEEIREAYDPELVATYREELDDEALEGEWPFADQLEALPEAEQSGAEPPGQLAGADSGPGVEQPTGSAPEPQPGTGAAPGREQQPPSAPPRQPPPGQPSAPSGPPPGPQRSGGSQPPQQGPAGGGAQPGSSARQAGQSQAGQPQQPQQGQGPPQGGQPQQGHHQPRQSGQPAPSVQPQERRLSAGQRGSVERAYDRLAELDSELATRQQQARAELASLPPGSEARSFAVSKHNLISDVRESLQDVANVLSSR